MSKSLTIWALIAPLAVAGCMTEGQFLASRIHSNTGRPEPWPIRSQSSDATGEVLSESSRSRLSRDP